MQPHNFHVIAATCQKNGWLSVVPIYPHKKNPMVLGWEKIATKPLSTDDLKSSPANAGLGFVYGGGDNIIAIDLDFLDQEAADAAYELTIHFLGASRLMRIGKAPKLLLLYRYKGTTPIGGKAFGGFEVFSTSGQTVFFGVHPLTGQPYSWPFESPLTCTPADAPEVSYEQLRALIDALRPYGSALPPRVRTQKTGVRGPRINDSVSSDRCSGAVADVLPHLREADDPVRAAIDLIATAQTGDRHHKMFGSVMALVILGYSNTEIRDHLLPAYRDMLGAEWSRDRQQAFQTAIAWARKNIGASADELARQPWVQSLQAEFVAGV